MVPILGYLGEFPKTRGTGTLYKDPTFEETILGSPIFGISHLEPWGMDLVLRRRLHWARSCI